MDRCPFCQMIRGDAPRAPHWQRLGEQLVAFEPLRPVTRGHRLVVPRAHVTPDGAPELIGHAMHYAARLAIDQLRLEAFNLVLSCGSAATQTVQHTHVHVVPRRDGDRLALPWSVPVEATVEAL